MSIKNIDVATLTATQRHQYVQSPDSDFFDRFKTAYAHYDTAEDAGNQTSKTQNAETGSLSKVMGLTFTEMAAMRGTSASDQTRYAEILNRAYGNGGMDDPVAFLKSLDPQEQGVVQRVHGLADAFNPETLSEEGAYNLLLPTGYQVDFNHDGIREVGAAKTIGFPPLDAPEEVKQAWLTATRDMSPGDMLTHQMSMHTMLYGISTHDKPPVALAPTDRVDSYREGIKNYLAMLEAFKAALPAGQYERDKAFFSEMQRLLG